MHATQTRLRLASLAHTDRYVRHLMPTEVIAMMRQRTWAEECGRPGTGVTVATKNGDHHAA
jgi:hypothetical protein